MALPPWVNTATEIVKASTLLSIIGVAELLLTTQELIARTFMSLRVLLLRRGLSTSSSTSRIERLGKFVERRLALELR